MDQVCCAVLCNNHFNALPNLILTALEHKHHYYTKIEEMEAQTDGSHLLKIPTTLWCQIQNSCPVL